MSVPSIPTTYTHNLQPISDFNVNTDVDGKLESEISGGLETTLAGSVGTVVSGNLNTNNVLKLTGDPKAPVVTDSKIDILNLPRFTLQDIKDMAKVRVRIPNYSNVCFKILGVELMSISMGGESQIITEPYVATAAEKCETDCCEPDTRPFPGRVKIIDPKKETAVLSKAASKKSATK
jgi:hypothetical protein